MVKRKTKSLLFKNLSLTMEVNETNRPLTETPMEQPIEARFLLLKTPEKETSAPKQTLEEVCNASNQREKRPD